MKKIVFMAAAILLLATSCQEKKMDRFVREAKEYTEKNCPQHLDNFTTLDSMVFVKKDNGIGNVRMYYSLQLTDEQKAIFMDDLATFGEENLRIVKTSVHFMQYKDAGVIFSYIYHDAVTGEKIVEYNYSPNEYN